MQRKRFKSESSKEHFSVNSLVILSEAHEDSKLESKSRADLSKKYPITGSKNESSTLKYVCGVLEDTDVENFDHEYGQFSSVHNSEEIVENQVEDLIEEYDDDIVENKTIHISSEKCLNEEQSKRAVEDHAPQNSSKEVLNTEKTVKNLCLSTFPYKKIHTNTQGKRSIVPSTSKSVYAQK